MNIAITVEPPLKGHLRDQDKCPLYRGVPSIEVTFIKIVGTFFSFGPKFVSLKWRCPLNRGVPKERFHCIKKTN